MQNLYSFLTKRIYAKMIEEHQGLKISCIKEIVFNNWWITKEELLAQGEQMNENQYEQHLINVCNGLTRY